jgi:hypothetical protein
MNSPAKDLAKYLSGQTGLGTFAGSTNWSLYVAVEPNEPVNVVTLYDLGGPGHNTDDLDMVPNTIQVRVRCESYSEGYEIHEIIRDLLVPNGPIVCETSSFVGVVMTADIASIGRDENNRSVLTATYTAIRNI